jgi:hypothetical protein
MTYGCLFVVSTPTPFPLLLAPPSHSKSPALRSKYSADVKGGLREEESKVGHEQCCERGVRQQRWRARWRRDACQWAGPDSPRGHRAARWLRSEQQGGYTPATPCRPALCTLLGILGRAADECVARVVLGSRRGWRWAAVSTSPLAPVLRRIEEERARSPAHQPLTFILDPLRREF